MGELRKWVFGIVGLLLVVSLVYSIRGYLQNQEYERRVRVAEQYADSVGARASTEAARADSVEAMAAALASRAQARDTVWLQERERVRVLAEDGAPEECGPFFAEYERLLDEAQTVAQDALGAYERQREATSHLRVAVDFQRARGDTLQATLKARPGPHNPFIPRPGFGLFAGLCNSGYACIGVGVTLSWSF